jgi:hypothetical protein
VARYILGIPAKPSPWGDRLHKGGAVTLLHLLLGLARERADETMGAVHSGSHRMLRSTARLPRRR